VTVAVAVTVDRVGDAGRAGGRDRVGDRDGGRDRVGRRGGECEWSTAEGAVRVNGVKRSFSLLTLGPLGCAMLAIVVVALPSAGSAQQASSDSQATSPQVLSAPPRELSGYSTPTESTSFDEATELERQEREADSQIRQGRVGLGVSCAALVGGVGVLMAGLFDRAFCLSDYNEGCGNGMIPGGIVMMALGSAGIVGTAFVIRRGKRAKRDLDDKQVETVLRLGPTSASVALRF
jgi:hypothetical protein